jgi:hypothetical protein
MPTATAAPENLPNCSRCVHYYITHEVNFRYGCRAMKFKSHRPPSLEVFAVTGVPCLYFQFKPR